MRISTHEQLPGCWVAVDDDTYDGPGSPIGSGRTQRQAVEDLLDQLPEGPSPPVNVAEIMAQFDAAIEAIKRA